MSPLFTQDRAAMDKIISTHGDCKVVEATLDHVASIYPFMRQADKIEVALMGSTPEKSLLNALEVDDQTFTALDADDVPFAMFGSGKLEVNCGYIWCLGTDGVNDNGYQFLKASRMYTQLLTKPYAVTFNYVHKANEAAIKWLKFCKAAFISETSFDNQPFYQFAIKYK